MTLALLAGANRPKPCNFGPSWPEVVLFLLCLETGGIITHDKYSLIPIREIRGGNTNDWICY